MRKKLLALASTIVLSLSMAGVAQAAEPVTLESQDWWNKSGIVVPTAVGSHIHIKATVPDPDTVVSGSIDIPITATLHNNLGKSNNLRIQAVNPSGSIIEVYNQPFVLGPCDDCTATRTITLNTSGWATGRHELRISLNIPDQDPTLSGSQRMYQSTGWQVCVRSCTPSYRSSNGQPQNFTEARGWYTGSDYANARLTSALSSVKSGGTISVKLAPGSGGDPTKFSGIYIDPDFHHGSKGTTVKEVNGPFTGSVTLPALTAGPHKLTLLSSDGKNAGVLVVFFTTP